MSKLKSLYEKIESVSGVLLDLADCDYETALENVKRKEELYKEEGVTIMNDYENDLFYHELRNSLEDALKGLKAEVEQLREYLWWCYDKERFDDDLLEEQWEIIGRHLGASTAHNDNEWEGGQEWD